MNRTCVALAAVAVMSLGAAPSNAQPADREARVPYAAGVGIDCERTLGCVVLVPKKGERYVRFTVTDASDTPVYGTVTTQRRSTPQAFGEGMEFCGYGLYPTDHGKPVYVYFENHLGFWHNCTGLASRGTLQATFLRSAPDY